MPEDIDRVLYIDAADTLVIGNIDDYYFADFENYMLIVTGARYKVLNGQVIIYEPMDLLDKLRFTEIARGLFNSGSYMINLSKMRIQNYEAADYLNISDIISNLCGKSQKLYFGDQGLLSLMFVGNIKYFGYPNMIDIWYMPYNFCLWYFDSRFQNPRYFPRIVHYVGGKFKPWLGKYLIFLKRFQDINNLRSLLELRAGQTGFYYLWHEYAILSDIRLKRNKIEDL